jgi:predicted amidohydrolase
VIVAAYQAAVIQAPIDVVTHPAIKDEAIAVNRDRAIAVVEHLLRTSRRPPRLFVFPVLFLQGPYDGRPPETVSIELPGPEIEPLIDLCRKHDVYLAGSCVEHHRAMPGHRFHSGFLVGPDGLLIRYPKAQARAAGGITIVKDVYDEYAAVFGADAVFPVVDTPLGKLAMLVESEILAPEVSRTYAAKGAEVLLHPNLERDQGVPASPSRLAFEHARAARAIENRLYVVSANNGIGFQRNHETGEVVEAPARGYSAIVGPAGRVLTCIAGPGEAYASSTLDIEALRKTREQPAPTTSFAPVLYQDTYRLEV